MNQHSTERIGMVRFDSVPKAFERLAPIVYAKEDDCGYLLRGICGERYLESKRATGGEK